MFDHVQLNAILKVCVQGGDTESQTESSHSRALKKIKK